MTTTIRKPKHDLDIKGEPVKHDRWVNVFFTKDGGTYTDTTVYSTEMGAKSANDRCMNERTALPAWIYADDSSWSFPECNYSHTIQMPVQS